MIYGPIESSSGGWFSSGDEVTPKGFKKELDALGELKELNIYINSAGGDVFAGQSIYNIIKRQKCIKNVYIDGLAASIASVIAMSGDFVYMPDNAMMMIHQPWAGMYGNSSEFRKMADNLDKISDTIIAVYVEKTGLPEDKVKELMDAETWMTAKDALDLGFIDEIESEKQVAASLKSGVFCCNGVEMDFSKFKNAPKFVGVESKESKVVEKETDKQKEAYKPMNIDLQLQILALKKKKYKF
jgi:ATP-dependent Clp protease protease subunit